MVKLKNCSLNELQKRKESGHTFLENVKKIKNGELYQYECVTPDGQRIKIRDLDDARKSKKVYSKGTGKGGSTTGLAQYGDNVSKASPFDLQATHSQTLSKKKMNKLIDDIKDNGISETIKYVEHNGQKYVVDGHHRLIAAKRLGLEQVPIEQVELPYSGYKTIEDLLWFD